MSATKREHGCTALLEVLWKPGAEDYVGHKVDFEDLEGLRFFLERGADVNERCCLHHAIARGRTLRFIQLILEAGADVDRPWTFWDVGRRPLALAARCGHLAAYELLESLGATAELDEVDAAVLAVARGESVVLPRARPPALGNPDGDDYGWILGQFALLDRTEIVAALLDSGLDVDTPGWSGFTPLVQAAAHGRRATVELLIERGASLTGRAWEGRGPPAARRRHLGDPEQPRARWRLPRHRRGARDGRRVDGSRAAERRPGRRPRPGATRRLVSGRAPAVGCCSAIRRKSRSSAFSSSCSSRRSGIFDALPVRNVSIAQARKHAAPSDVFQLAAARSSTEPLEGTTYPATAEIPKKTQPRRLTAGCHHPSPPRAGSQPCHPWRTEAR